MLALALQSALAMGDKGDKIRKVLVVDDSALMHRLYDTMLSEWRAQGGDQIRKEYLEALKA